MSPPGEIQTEDEFLDATGSDALRDLMNLASSICRAPVAFFHPIEGGLDEDEIAGLHSAMGFDASSVRIPSNIVFDHSLIVISDVASDKRFAGESILVQNLPLRFYAGAPVRTLSGRSLGALCVLDSNPRDLDDFQRGTLQNLAKQAAALAELRLAVIERDRKLRQKDLMLEEVNHRVKNSLQLIVSLIQLQMRNVTDPVHKQQIGEIANRIRTMAVVHGHLYQNDHAPNFVLEDYLQGICDGLASSLDIDIAIDAEHVELPMEAVVPLALIINELITNAAKYAKPQQHPRISIVSRKFEANLLLTISDNGKGLPDDFDMAHSTGLGMKVVNALVKQLHAKIVARSTNGGASFELSIPLLVG